MKNLIIDRKILANNIIKFALSKPNFERANYYSNTDFQKDYRSYKKDADYNRQFIKIKNVYNMLNCINDKDIINCFNDRLTITEDNDLKYCAGQYYCTEYQYALKCSLNRLYGYYLNS